LRRWNISENTGKKGDDVMKDHDFKSAPDLGKALDQAAKKLEARSVEIDVEKYQAYLDDPSLSDTQKEEIIHALWTIIVAFVELGFGVHPTQQACGQVERGLDLAGEVDSDRISPKDADLKQEFNEGP